jgi:hypothetical protein
MRRRFRSGASLVLLVAACQGPGSGAADPATRVLTVADDWQARLPSFPRYEAGETVLRWMTAFGGFAVHYTLGGRNGVPAADADRDGVPDQAQQVGLVLEEALSFYRDQLGARLPLASLEQEPPGPLDVFLVDFAGRGDGQYMSERCRPEPSRVCQGMLLLENDFTGYGYGSAGTAIRIVGSHELFHAIQAAYGAEKHSVLSEGTAVWATEAFDPRLDDFERSIPGYLAAPEQPLAVPPAGPATSFSYGSGLFFRFLSERLGPAMVPALLERSGGPAVGVAPRWMTALSELLEERHATTFAAEFADFAVANALTGPRAGPLGYQEARRYPPVATQRRPLPLSEQGLRAFPASTRVFTVRVGGRPQLRAALTNVEGEGALELAVMAPRAGVWAVAGRDPREVIVEGPFDQDSEVIIVVSNGALAGPSTRAGLCAGDEAELAACRAAMPPAASPPASAAAPGSGGCSLGRARASGSFALGSMAPVVWLLALSALRSAPRGRCRGQRHPSRPSPSRSGTGTRGAGRSRWRRHS